MKLPKFMMVEAPTSEIASATTFVLHTEYPRFLSVIVTDGIDDEYINNTHPLSELASYIPNDTGILELYNFVPIDDLTKYEPDLIKIIMRDMAKWYLDYLAWEDRLAHSGGTQLLLEDFSPKMPNMKIITNELETNYILIYEGKMRVFKSEHSIKKYISQLGFTEADFRTGYINIAKKSPQVGLN